MVKADAKKAGLEHIEDVYPLSPMQEGILFESLYVSDSVVYVTQASFRFVGLDVEAFRLSWQQIVDRHPVLRTAFVWENLERPLQVVGKRVKLPLVIEDWRRIPRAEQAERFETFLAEERKRGLELSRAPLMRLSLFRLRDDVYSFVFSHHHLILDGWSLELMLRELFAFYEARCRGRSPELESPRPFRDYIAWLGKQDTGLAEQFWRRELRGLHGATRLGAESVRTNTSMAVTESSVTQRLSSPSSQGLGHLGRRHGLTANTLAQGAWALVLSRYSGERDVVFGATVSGRPESLEGVQRMFGLFINTLPVRVEVTPAERLLTWLEKLQARQVEMRRFEHSSLVKLRQWSEVASGEALFESILVFENHDAGLALGNGGGSLEIQDVRSHIKHRQPFLLGVVPEARWVLKAAYDPRHFEATTVRRALRHLATVLEDFVTLPDRRLGERVLASQAERQQLLVEWGQARQERRPERCLHELFAERAARWPEAMALVCEERQLTCGELNRRANRLAHRLRELGVGPEVLVGLLVERGPDMLVAILAILKAGGAYVALDSAYPQERLSFLLKDAGARILLAQERLVASLPAAAPRTLCMDAPPDARWIAAASDDDPPGPHSPDQLTYVLYTSGSTGKPKGVPITHSNVVRLLASTAAWFSFGTTDSWPLFHSYAFDVSVWEIWGALLHGGRLVVVPYWVSRSPEVFRDLVIRERITVLNQTPSAFRQFTWAEEAAPPLRSCLRCIIFAGEALELESLKPWLERYGDASPALINMYGITETTVHSTYRRVRWDDVRRGAGSVIGVAIPDLRLYVLDPHQQPVPVAVPGEIYVGGPGLARGYLRRARLTAERFLPDPFCGEPGERGYRSGDLARRLPHGELEYLGRIDNQIKIRGFRIELGEIETTLTQHPAVRTAVVVAHRDSGGDKRLVAYVVTAADGAERSGSATSETPPFEAAPLRAHLERSLPDYMVPAVFVRLDEMPETPSGKLDRRALPAPEQISPEQARDYAAPRGPIAQSLAAIWADVLALERIDARAHFFDLGGHSLLATRVMSRIREVFGVELTIRQLFENPALSSLTNAVEVAIRKGQGLESPPVEPVPRDRDLPLSFAQQRLWFLDQLHTEGSLYNIPAPMRLLGRLELAVLERSLSELVRRHEVLRTGFHTRLGRPRQVIRPPAAFSIPVVDLRHLSGGGRQAEARRLVAQDAVRPFDLERPPLVRLCLLRLAAEEHQALLCLHHIVADGRSLEIVVREIAALYPAFAAGCVSPLSELPVQYADFAVWQRRWLRGEARAKLLEYWRNQLEGAPPVLDLPTDRARPAVRSVQGDNQVFRLPAPLADALKELGRRAGATFFMVLLAAFKALLYRCTGQGDVVVGFPIAHRSRVETEGLIGFFVNNLVVRARLRPGDGFRSLLRRVREVTLDGYVHQELPFELLVDELEPARDLSYSPLFQVMLVLQNQDPEDTELPGLTLMPLPISTRVAKFDLTLSLIDRSGVLPGSLEYNRQLFDRCTVRRLLAHFRNLLESAVAAPERPVGALELLGPRERHQLLAEWNDTRVHEVEECLFHGLIEAHVRRRAEAAALVFKQDVVSYGELERRAVGLAHELRRLGVGPETRVGLCVDRSLELVVAILAILKAGGAYLPLDPSYPKDRLAYMLEDAGVAVLLTQQRFVLTLPAHDARVLCVDAPRRRRVVGDTAPLSGVVAGNLAYVIYTSGSTGRPKGVLVSHRGMANLMRSQEAFLGVNRHDRVLQFSALSFDASVSELTMALGVGATLHLASRETLLPGPDLARLLLTREITNVTLPPSALAALPAVELPALQALVVAGEACPAELVASWAPGRRFFNNYGPTETTIWASVDRCRGEGKPSIGRAIHNTRAYLFDRDLRGVPPVVAGELHLGGVGLARGYWNRAALTARSFIADPISGEPGERLYKTGDLVRYTADGRLDFLGRIDHQVKIRGFRIELGEVEAALGGHPSVQESVVMAQDPDAGKRGSASGRRLVAYVVPHRMPGPRVEELRRFLAGKLPDYMVPARFVTLEALALTGSGKVDRGALKAPGAQRPDLAGEWVAPRTEVEEKLAAIWSRVLGVERLGVHDNFFALGGDSILSIQIVSRARQAGLLLTPQTLFQHQSIAELAPTVRELSGPAAESGPVVGPVPLTPVQHWFFERDLPEPHHFNQGVLLEVNERWEPRWLARLVSHLVRHHDALRLRFLRRQATWEQQATSPDDDVPASWIDLSELPADTAGRELGRAAARLHASLDLSAGPLLRVASFDLGRGGQRLLVAAHHLAVDGVSWRVLLEDLVTAHRQLREGRPIELAAKTTSFKAWAEGLTGLAQGGALQGDELYWLEAAGSRAGPLPVDVAGGGPAADLESFESSVSVALDADATRALLTQVPGAYRTQINDALLTALTATLSRFSGASSVWIDLEGHGREGLLEDCDLSRTVGWFTSLFPVCLELPLAARPGQALCSVKEQLRRLPRRGVSYGLLRYLGADAVLAEKLRALPHPEVSFNYLGRFDQVLPRTSPFRLARESSGRPHSPRAPRSHLLSINGAIVGERLEFSWTYSLRVHHKETIEGLARDFIADLQALIEHCASPEAGGYTPSDFPLARLDQATLDRVFAARGIEDVYPLAPLQAGMLFHTLYAPDSQLYFEQLSCELRGPLDVSTFQTAWQRVVERHTALRTSFAWEGLEKPLQVIHEQVEIPWTLEDWRTAPDGKARLEDFLEADRRLGFEISRAPLLRFALIRLEDDVHRFVWSMHHVLADGWCLPLLLNEFWTFYDRRRRRAEVQLTAAPQYRDYVAWLEEQDLSRAEAYWRRRLQGFRAATPLMADRRSGDVPDRAQDYRTMELGMTAAATSALESLARRRRWTVNTLVQGAWALLLSRYSGEEDVLFGTTVSGRPAELPGVESIVGLFINTLPMRVRASSRAAFGDWLREFQEQQVEMRRYEYTPLVEVQGWSDVPQGSPLFETIVVFENYPVEPAAGALGDDPRSSSAPGTLRVARADFFERANYPLSLMAVPGPCMLLRGFYDRGRFDAATVRRALKHLRALLQAMTAASESPLGTLPMLSSGERHQLLREWNDTRPAKRRERLYHELIEDGVDRHPESVAVVFARQRLSYSELDRRAAGLARELRELGVGPETRVGLAVERTPELVVGLVGILKAGGAYLPLDPSYPKERLGFMLEDSGVAILLTREHLVKALPTHAARQVYVDVERGRGSPPAAVPRPTTEADNLAYVIYTSGSTGRPKGVLVSHRGLANLSRSQVELLGVGRGDRVLQFSALSFDASVFEVVMALGAGATLYLAHRETLLPGPDLARLLRRLEITNVTMMPSALAALGEVELPALARLVVAGEACPGDLVKRWAPGRRFFNAYGPTEATIWSTVARCREAARPSIGYPIGDTRVYVLDRDLEVSPIGVAGELYIGGIGLARGYWNRPALTAERFVADAESGTRGSRLYKTGDLVRLTGAGQLDFLGRIDHQVKIRGFRVELGEVEVVLARYGGLQEVAVVARQDVGAHGAAGRSRLVAYVVASGERSPDGSQLRRYLREHLPEPMVPASFVELSSLPLTPGGKVDRQALPEPARQEPGEYRAPETPIEELVAGTWCEVLNLERVAATDNFFELGGHSLLVTQVTSRLREALGVELALSTIFEHPTLAELATEIEELRRTGARVEAPPIVPVSRQQELPLSFAQQRLWFLDQLDPGQATFNIPVAMRFDRDLRLPPLERSLNEVVRRHEALRTNFTAVDGRPVQIVGPPVARALSRVDLARLSPEPRSRALSKVLNELAERPFDLARDPLFRAHVVWLGEGCVVSLVLHHIVSDGWSMAVLMRETEALYEAFSRGEPSPLPDLPVQYADFADWQRRWLRGDVLEAQVGYWRRQLEGAPSDLDLPTHPRRPAGRGFRGAAQTMWLDETLSSQLAARARHQDATLYMALLAGFFTLLRRFAGQDDIVVATAIANRNRREIEGLVGFFVNTLLLRVDLSDNPSFSDLIRRVREVSLGAYLHQDLPFEKLVEELKPERDARELPWIRVMFVFQNVPYQLERRSSPSAGLMRAQATPDAKFALALYMIEEAGRIRGQWIYDQDLFEAATIRRLAETFLGLLEEVAAHPERRLSGLAVGGGEESEPLIDAFNVDLQLT